MAISFRFPGARFVRLEVVRARQLVRGMLGSVRLRFGFAWLALSVSLAACAVYDASLMPPNALDGEAGQPNGGSPAASSGAGGALGSAAGNAAAGSEHSEVGEAGESGDAGASNAGGNSGAGTTEVGGAPNGGHAGSLTTGGSAGALAIGGADASAGTVGVGGTVGVAGGGDNGGALGVAGALAGGSAGGAGAPSVLACADYPFSVKTSWVATASHQSTTPKNLPSALVDGTNARWSSGKAQSGDEWIQVDFGATVSLRSINLQQGSDSNDYPRSYAVIVSDTKNDLSGVVRASGIGTSGVTTTIVFPKVIAGRYLLIKQLGSSLSWWSVAEVEPSCVDG